jgi:uncharacterized protein YndB with AHSA1/START domain/mannose-6-phosphate isomerase-like protein (cupin superfamily)
MVKPGDVLEADALGVRLEIRRTAEETGGELVEFDVVGRARGFLTQPHVHATQVERHEVVEGALRLVIDGREHVLGPGHAMEVPAGAAHRQLAGGPGSGRVRVQLRPAGRTEAFLERLAELARAGELNRWGFPRPRAAAALVIDFADAGHAARPPMAVQRPLARAILRASEREYVFVDEWDVAAPREAVFAALADARTYPQWWRPVYIDVDADGEPAVGKVSRQHFKGRLPYHLRTRSTIVRLEPPHVVEGDVDGDLRGRGTWTLTESSRGTHVRFDWRVHADRRLLRVLTPILRPAFRWNHDWAIARAIEGLEPFAARGGPDGLVASGR